MKIQTRIAHIVPVDHLEQTKDNSYHMSLAHLAEVDEIYCNFYRRMSDEGKFVLMDNGCAEGAQIDVDRLIAVAEKLHPTELVLPDTLYDGASTYLKSFAALARFNVELSFKPRYMAVPQGSTVEEWFESAKQLLRLPINTIGVSKFLPIATKDPDSRVKAVALLTRYLEQHTELHDVEIHLLGCDEGPAKMREIFVSSPYVRGCDSAFAYIAAQAGVVINTKTLRPEGEIDFLHGNIDGEVLEVAMHNFDVVAGIRTNTGVWC